MGMEGLPTSPQPEVGGRRQRAARPERRTRARLRVCSLLLLPGLSIALYEVRWFQSPWIASVNSGV